jgi:hypothetical protein
VCHKVCSRHLAAGEEGDRAGQPTEYDAQSAEDLDDTRQSHQRKYRYAPAGWSQATKHTKQLLGAMAGEQESNHDAHDRIEIRRVLSK